MDYEKAYKDALAKARHYYLTGKGEPVDFIKMIFPEFAESEDEKIKKHIISVLEDCWQTCKNIDYDSSRIQEDIAWLEKQKLTKNINKEDEEVRQYLIRTMKRNDINVAMVQKALAWLEKQGEQKPADNFKQKFKVGDWVTNDLCVWRIDSIDEDMYYMNHCGIDCGGDIKSIDEEYHIWTIQDAKDGDVLSYRNGQWIFILKRIIDKDSLKYYTLWSTIHNDLTINDSAFSLLINSFYPATKEQRDLLFSKMKEAGYEWDAEKKELKKIEPFDKYEGLTDFERTLAEICIGWIGEEPGWKQYIKDNADVLLKIAVEKFNSVQDVPFEQKPAWSEEDEENMEKILDAIGSYYYLTTDDDVLCNWLKSLKQRIGG